ncbi:MAG: AMP-binding protein [Proteobacteria bacterium]|nr:AMP-binding protein [Pseudomonadota bacterium]
MTRRDSLEGGSASDLSPSEAFAGRQLFLLGGTGFLGKVTLAMLLHNFPAVGRVYVMVRAGSGTSSEDRFWSDVVGSPVFDPLRERYGAALEGLLRDKVRVVDGDITRDDLGLGAAAAEVAANVDVILNSSGKVTFNPALDQSLRTNVNGTRNIIAFAKRLRRPALVHVSTCFVAGNRSGDIWENEPVVGYFPRHEELEGARFDVEQEIADCAQLAARVRAEADDAVQTAYFFRAARERLREEGRDPENERYLKLAQARERKNWIRDRLTALGIERAARWGWPNIYCYSKALAEQLVAREEGLVRAIVRPSIVESAVAFPFPGWNEGFTTTAPLTFLALKGQNLFLASEKLILDLTPVDHIAAGLLSVAAQCCVGEPELVYQLASGDTNPVRMQQVVALLGLYKRKHFQRRDEGPRWINALLARMEARPASAATFARSSAPLFRRTARQVGRLLDEVQPRWGARRVAETVERLKGQVQRVEQVMEGVEEAFAMYRPFTVDNHYVFRTDHLRALQARFVAAERPLLPWGVAALDWHHYWMSIHFPGLEKWVFPELERDFAAKPPKTIFTYNSLIELLETAARLHPTRVALRMERDGHDDRYTYADLRELAARVAGFLQRQGVQPGARVMLLCENRPEWAMCYFGVIDRGCTCVPVDKQSSVVEIVNLVRAGGVAGVLLGEGASAGASALRLALDAAEHEGVALWTLAQALAPAVPEQPADEPAPRPRLQSDAVASLIFTSGTTGQPKGVMLTQRNLTAMTAELTSVFDLRPTDGLLSVLPLHHTLEFSAGLLLPLAHGAQITYLREMNGDALSGALRSGKVTAIVGVPALWELLRRRLRSGVGEHGAWLTTLLDGAIRGGGWLREHTPVNPGLALLWPLHARLGGRLRYLISGGSPLAEEVNRFFYGLGLPLLEGYGLTEASPVLTVTRPHERPVWGSVGQPLPRIELQVVDPDGRGVGEIIARGPTVMAGYYGNEAATTAALRDGWLYTGDLGYLDDARNLFLVGRSKDLIVDADGRNVYPDELEELYGGCPLVKELSVVGLPDGHHERVAALVVPDPMQEPTLGSEEREARIRDHFRAVSATLPFHKRIKLLELTNDELPRTATRKVRRNEVLFLLERRLRRTTQGGGRALDASGAPSGSGHDWLIELVAQVSGRARAQLTLDTRLEELGFDSLMYSELAAAIEHAGGTLGGLEDITALGSMRELAAVARRVAGGAGAASASWTSELRSSVTAVTVAGQGDEAAAAPGDASEARTLRIPSALATVGSRALDQGQSWIYRHLFDCRFEGRANIPYHTHFILAANHCSHLDSGLAKLALHDRGTNLHGLAAADYFFDTPLKRAYFENFTKLVPMDRSGSLRRSLRQALDLLAQGHDLLIFPEGTRSPTGELQEFKPSLGYLAAHARVGVLPVYIWGSYEALPKGGLWPKQREVGARVGPLLEFATIERLTAGLPRSESYRAIALAVQRQIEAMRDGRPCWHDVEALRAAIGLPPAPVTGPSAAAAALAAAADHAAEGQAGLAAPKATPRPRRKRSAP